MPWPMRFGPPPRIMTLLPVGRLGLALGRDVARRSSTCRACASRTRRRRCRRACRPGARRARGGACATSASSTGRRARASRASEKPFRFSSSSASASLRQAVLARPRPRSSTISSICAQEPRVDLQACCDLLDATGRRGTPRRSTSMRSGVGRASAPTIADCRASPLDLDLVRSRSRPVSSPRSAFCSDSWNVRPIAITSPTDFICGGQQRLGAGEFLEREARDLGDDVVDRRLERRRRRRR